MINNYLNLLKGHFNKDNFTSFDGEISLIVAEYIEAIETDLKKEGRIIYVDSVPDDFKDDPMLKAEGYRILYPLLRTEPPEIPIYVGKTTMHIKSNPQNNLNSLLLIYVGNTSSESSDPSDLNINAYEQAIVALSEDGALSAVYDSGTKDPCVCTWFPQELVGDGRLAYPENITDLNMALEQKFNQKGMNPSPEIWHYMLPDIVMLAVQTYEESVPLKGKIIIPSGDSVN